MMENRFKVVNINDYINGLLNANCVVVSAYKITNIIVRPFKEAQHVTYASGMKEADYQKNNDKNVYLATKLDKDNKPVTDSQGHLNQWVISEEELNRRYILLDEKNCIYSPKRIIQRFIKSEEDITFVVDGGITMNLIKGGYINITNPYNFYGIQEQDFLDTYIVL